MKLNVTGTAKHTTLKLVSLFFFPNGSRVRLIFKVLIFFVFGESQKFVNDWAYGLADGSQGKFVVRQIDAY